MIMVIYSSLLLRLLLLLAVRGCIRARLLRLMVAVQLGSLNFIHLVLSLLLEYNARMLSLQGREIFTVKLLRRISIERGRT